MSRPLRITSQAVDRNIKQQRNLDTQRRELGTFAAENAKLLSAAAAQEKIEIRRRQAQQDAYANELQFEENMRMEQRNKSLHQRTIAQNNQLAAQLELEYSEEERQRKEIQRLCDESPELRDLERALKIAYLNKERSVQHEEKILLASREQERIQAIEEQMEHDRTTALKQEQIEIEAKKRIYQQQRKVLQKQIEERRQALADAQRQTELDREMVDEIVTRINQEDEADMQRKRDMQAATAKMVREYEKQRQRELAEARAREKAEEDRILAYNRSIEQRSEGVAAKKQAKKDEDDRILKKIVEETERKRKEEEEFNSLRDMLWEEELEAKRAHDAQQRVQKQREVKREMMEANDQMMKLKTEARLREAENEARMVVLLKKKFAEDEAREREEEEARRNSKKNYMSLIEKQKMERKQMTDAERAQELFETEEQRKREAYRKQVIQEARKRLLEEHAQKLAGFIPGTAFDNAEEYEAFNRAALK